MRCKEIMKRDVECASPEETVQSAAQRMRDEEIGFLPVCDANKKVLGTITDRDLTIRVLAGGMSPTTTISDVFTRDIVACRPDDKLETAQDMMARHHKSRIMCIDEHDQLIGVISLSDIAQQGDGSAAKTLRKVSEREIRA
jgi:CBS domain-containing protein